MSETPMESVDNPGDEVVTISRKELEELRAAAEAGRPGREAGPPEGRHPAVPAAEASARREEALARELAARDRRVTDLESAYRKTLCERELATALAGRPLAPGAASQLIKLWRDDFDVYEESGESRVAARDGRAVAEWVADRLAGPDFAHFCTPSSRGGAGPRGLSQAGTAAASPLGRTLGEAVVAQWRESAAARTGLASGPSGWGRR